MSITPREQAVALITAAVAEDPDAIDAIGDIERPNAVLGAVIGQAYTLVHALADAHGLPPAEMWELMARAERATQGWESS